MAVAEEALTAALAPVLAAAGLEADLAEYAAAAAAASAEEARDAGPAAVRAAVREAAEPFLEDALEGAAAGRLEAVLAQLGDLAVAEDGEGEAGAADGLLVDCRDIILAYPGAPRPLLRRADLRLAKGRKYGMVGRNGVGKTTLISRIAAGDIGGVPAALKTVFVRHEVLAVERETVTAFMTREQAGTPAAEVRAALERVGFTAERQAASVAELSGGWRMRLALAQAMLENADLLLLDEPTNHLDQAAVAWLAGHLRGLEGTTAVVVSHDYPFLERMATDIVFFDDGKLLYYEGSFAAFKALRPEVVAELPSTGGFNAAGERAAAARGGEAGPPSPAGPPITLPDPGPLDGVRSKGKTVMKVVGFSHTYPGAAAPVLAGVTARVFLRSRIAIVGPNGAGKTTLMKLLVGDLAHHGEGTVWQHQNLRVSYIAQHFLHHLEDNLHLNPKQYVQDRFFKGRDKELAAMETIGLTAEEERQRGAPGQVREVVGRVKRAGQLEYEVEKNGRKPGDTVWVPLSDLRMMPPHVLKLARDYDERLKVMQSGMEVRPITNDEVLAHLAAFGVRGRLAEDPIRGMSGGQKSRLVIAAAMWNKPHLIALDEPTNYLDNETMVTLTAALERFKGAVVTISHNARFVGELAAERWELDGAGGVTVVRGGDEGGE